PHTSPLLSLGLLSLGSSPRPRCRLLAFCRPGHHHDLHSFPTRRSSDLLRRLADRAEIVEAMLALEAEAQPVMRRHDVERGGTGRSEEHTSELQSHLNLVCRLLLEKKNTEFLSPLLGYGISKHTSYLYLS